MGSQLGFFSSFCDPPVLVSPTQPQQGWATRWGQTLSGPQNAFIFLMIWGAWGVPLGTPSESRFWTSSPVDAGAGRAGSVAAFCLSSCLSPAGAAGPSVGPGFCPSVSPQPAMAKGRGRGPMFPHRPQAWWAEGGLVPTRRRRRARRVRQEPVCLPGGPPPRVPAFTCSWEDIEGRSCSAGTRRRGGGLSVSEASLREVPVPCVTSRRLHVGVERPSGSGRRPEAVPCPLPR